MTQRHFFFHLPSPFPGNFCNCDSGGICTASQLYVQLPLLYTVWSNAHTEIGPEVTLQPLVSSWVKDYKWHSLVQTSFTELPNRQNHCILRLRIRFFNFLIYFLIASFKSELVALQVFGDGHFQWLWLGFKSVMKRWRQSFILTINE